MTTHFSGRRRGSLVLALLLACSFAALLPAQATPQHIRTRWAADMKPDAPLPEYPRPQLVRSPWTNLNGKWDYAIAAVGPAEPAKWDGTIVVPFPVQSQLSGVERAVSDSQQLWYHRSFARPALTRGTRLLLHFGAVDWDAIVYVNGVKVGEHRGGYDPFTFDITSALRGNGDQQLVVTVLDPTDRGPEPRGKQVLRPHSIWYSAVTGIWQTVWLEPVHDPITGVLAVPNIDSRSVELTVFGDSPRTDVPFRATVLAGGNTVTTARGKIGAPILLRVPGAHLWSPSDPYLYDLRIVTGRDTVMSYFGMRKIAVAKDSAGVNRLFLNNQPLFEYGTLDQGWWPDGLYTAPTDEALRFDIEQTKRLGFNLIRKHVKVEPERWYYDADKLGMLVWQDMPSGDNDTPAGKAEFEAELHAMVDALRDHPSIVMWVPFNEGWGQHDTERYVAWLKAYDPTRLVNNATGWTDKHVGDVVDVHAYPGPAMPPLEAHRAAVLGEFGGLGLPIEGHTWLDRNNWGYRTFTSTDALGAAYRDLLVQLRYLIADGLAAAIYTQTTDVEVEVNGLMTYDRKVVKFPVAAVEAAATLWKPLPKITSVVATSQQTGQPWRFTTTTPPANWYATGFNDGSWQSGPGGFGTDSTPGAVVRTRWNTGDIWLRRSFTLPSAAALANPVWRIHHDEDAEVYLNGELVARLPGYTAGYVRVPLDAHARGLLRNGTNSVAIHVHQTTGGQYIDLGLDDVANP